MVGVLARCKPHQINDLQHDFDGLSDLLFEAGKVVNRQSRLDPRPQCVATQRSRDGSKAWSSLLFFNRRFPFGKPLLRLVGVAQPPMGHGQQQGGVNRCRCLARLLCQSIVGLEQPIGSFVKVAGAI
jgi:hypothetical protein